MKRIKEIFVFDIDGVLTSLKTHKIEEKDLINFIVKILERGEPVSFNTGRAIPWVKQNLISKIEEEIPNKSFLSNLFAVGEKGGAWIEFNTEGNESFVIDKNIKFPEVLEEELRKLIHEKFSNKIRYEEGKKTMASLLKSDLISRDDYDRMHAEIDSEIEKILINLDLNNTFKIVPTTLDTDIESVNAGKDAGMKKILDWLKEKNYEAQEFVTFGDSLSDLAMAEHLAENNHNVRFIYVGDKEIDPKDYKFQIILTKEKFDKGTLEYLSSI